MEIYIHAKHVLTRLLSAFIFLAIPFSVFAQQTEIPLINSRLEGIVTDSTTKQPITGVTLRIKGVTHSVSTGSDGRFVFITGQKLPYTLVVSFIGYNTKEVYATGSPVVIKLSDKVSQLNDVVIVGYGTQKKSDVTGAISTIPKDNLKQVTSSVDNLLRGAAPGVQVTQSSGAPGASASVRIRGGNSITGGNEPLYVIDGFPVYNDNSTISSSSGGGASVNALSTINPSDIESIEVLKDASATAIYGSRGANGVIIVTTKKGKRGTNDVTYQGYYGTQKLSKEIPLLDATQWAELRNDILASSNQPPSFTDAQIAALGQGTNWQEAAFRSAPVQNHELTLSGGDEKSRYNISGNYFDQQGILLNTDFKRYSLRYNYDKDISTKFHVGINATTTYSISEGAAANIAANSLNSPNVITNILTTPPVLPVKDANGNYVLNPYSTTPSNPIQDLLSITNQTKVNRTLGNLFGEYTLAPGLKAKVSLGADLISSKANFYAPSYTGDGYSTLGYATVGAATSNSWLDENTLTYNTTINNDHDLNILVGYTTQYFDNESVTAGSKNFVSNITTYNSLQSGSQILTPTSNAYSWALNSYLARVNYSYLHKYNLTVSARADGSSRFGSGNKWGYFPSAGFSWNAGSEDFIKRIPTISNLKLRLSAGETGNTQIGEYQSLALFSPFNYTFNTQQVGLAQTQLANSNLKWEKTAQYDGGIDLGLFDSRVNLVFDAYYKKTTNLLLAVPVPLSSGYSQSLQNIGSVENKGIEIGINTDNINSGSFVWKTSLVYSLNRNKVLSLGNSETSFFPAIPGTTLGVLQPEIIKVGLPLGTFWGYKTAGVFQNAAEIAQYPTLNSKANTKPGDQRYLDLNNDGLITAADKTNLGNAQPKFTGGLTNTFSYKGVDLVVFLQGSYGGKVYNALRQQLEITNLSQNAWGEIADRWTPSNTNTSVPRASNNPVAQMSDRFIENDSYLRLKNLVLGYTFSNNLISKIRAKQIRIYVSAQNLVTWTKYTGYDPEVNSFEQNNTAQGIDYGAYPNYKTYLLGLSVTF
jgi:TonB-linked SusC/RagA family outer membrane protein